MDGSALLALAIGWLSAGLVNYLGDVLPRRRKLVKPFCLRCAADQAGLSYWLWPGRCASCGRPRGLRAALVFLAGAAAAVFLWLTPDLRLPFWLNLLIWMYFGLVIVIDMEHRLILHSTSYVGAALGLTAGAWLHGIPATLWGGAAGFAMMLALYWLGGLFARLVSQRRRAPSPAHSAPGAAEAQSEPPGEADGEELVEDALGFGDVNLAGIIGLFLGWPGIIAGLMGAILLGGAASLLYIGAALLARRYRAFTAIPYGPFLAIAALFLLYFS